MAKIVSALLIPWEPGKPGIAYELDDGYEGSVDGRFALTIPGLIEKLSPGDLREFEEQMSVNQYDGLLASGSQKTDYT